MKILKKIIVIVIIMNFILSISTPYKVFAATTQRLIGDTAIPFTPTDPNASEEELINELIEKIKESLKPYGYTGGLSCKIGKTGEDTTIQYVALWSSVSITIDKESDGKYDITVGTYKYEGLSKKELTDKWLATDNNIEAKKWYINGKVDVTIPAYVNSFSTVGNIYTELNANWAIDKKEAEEKMAAYAAEHGGQEETLDDLEMGDIDDAKEYEPEEQDEEDIGGIFLTPIISFFNVLVDGFQSIMTMFMRAGSGWRDVMVGKELASDFKSISDDGKKRLTPSSVSNGESGDRDVIWYFDKDGNARWSDDDNVLLRVTASKDKPSWWPEGKAELITETDAKKLASVENDTMVTGLSDNDVSLGGNKFFIDATSYKTNYSYPQIAYSPEEIFAGDIDLLNANFFNTDGVDENSSFITIRNIIMKWFLVLRYIGITGLLSVLIYSGIKIMRSSVASDKAKYKERVVDWFVAIVLMFLLPYIMTFIFTVTDKLVDLFNDDNNKSNSITVYVYDEIAGNDGTLTDITGAFTRIPIFGKLIFSPAASAIGTVWTQHLQKFTYTKFTTNLMGLVRFQIQSRNAGKKIAYEVMYIMLIVFSIRFTIIYLKRMLYIAFLTMISPIVVMMYPIDKLGDGRSQSFEMWLKEYIFNALLQPLHMLIYYVFVTSAMSFACENVIYVLVVFGFMTQAEKILKQIFGFNSPFGTVGGISGGAVTAMKLSTLTNAASTLSNIVIPGRNKGSKDVDYSDSDSSSSSGSDILDYSQFPGIEAPVGDDSDNDDKFDDIVKPQEIDNQMALESFDEDEKQRYNDLVNKFGMDPDFATKQVQQESKLGILGDLSADEERRYNDMVLKKGMDGEEALKEIIKDRFSPAEQADFNNLTSSGMDENEAIAKIMANRNALQMPKIPENLDEYNKFSLAEKQKYNDLLNSGVDPDDAVEKIINARKPDSDDKKPKPVKQQIEDKVKEQGSDPVTFEVPKQPAKKVTAPKGTFETLKMMAGRRYVRARTAIKNNVTPRRVITGAAKVAGLAGAGALGAGAVLTQAAISIAMDGKYSPLEGVTTFATATLIANKGINKAGKSAMGVYDEVQKNRYQDGKKNQYTMDRKAAEFVLDNKNIQGDIEANQDFGYAKTSIEIARSTRLNSKGIETEEDRKKVKNYTDYLVDQEFERKYKGATEEDIHEIGRQIRQNAKNDENGDKNFAGLTDKDAIKVALRTAVSEDRTMSLEDQAINTLNAQKDLEGVVNLSKEKQEAWLAANVDEEHRDQYRGAIEAVKQMNIANRKYSIDERKKELKEDYATKTESDKKYNARDKSEGAEIARKTAEQDAEQKVKKQKELRQEIRDIENDKTFFTEHEKQSQLDIKNRELQDSIKETERALEQKVDAMKKEAKNGVEAQKLSDNQEVRDWQFALMALEVAKKNDGKLSKSKLKEEITSKYGKTLGTRVDSAVDTAITTLTDAGCMVNSGASGFTVNYSTLGKGKLNKFMSNKIKGQTKKRRKK